MRSELAVLPVRAGERLLRRVPRERRIAEQITQEAMDARRVLRVEKRKPRAILGVGVLSRGAPTERQSQDMVGAHEKDLARRTRELRKLFQSFGIRTIESAAPT